MEVNRIQLPLALAADDEDEDDEVVASLVDDNLLPPVFLTKEVDELLKTQRIQPYSLLSFW